MELAGSNGDRFELTILGYQFPYSSEDKYDANWLVVRTAATIAGGTWSSVDPSLLTWEVEELISWLESSGHGMEVSKLLDFMEPNVSFEMLNCSAQTVTLKVVMQLESRPPWQSWTRPGECPEGPVLNCSREELFAWAADLRNQLSKFPNRKPVGSEQSPITND